MAAPAKRKDQRVREARQQEIFDALKGVLVSLGHEVTVSRTLEGRGGECLVRGTRRVIVSRRLPMSERIEVLVDVVAHHDLAALEVPPLLHDLLGVVGREPGVETSAPKAKKRSAVGKAGS
jgi:hypothetical protein